MHRYIAIFIMSPILIYIHPFWRMYFQNKKLNKKLNKRLNIKNFLITYKT